MIIFNNLPVVKKNYFRYPRGGKVNNALAYTKGRKYHFTFFSVLARLHLFFIYVGIFLDFFIRTELLKKRPHWTWHRNWVNQWKTSFGFQEAEWRKSIFPSIPVCIHKGRLYHCFIVIVAKRTINVYTSAIVLQFICLTDERGNFYSIFIQALFLSC